MATNSKSTDERKEMIARQLSTLVAQGGRVESQGDFQAVVISGRRINHILHFLLCIPTLGIWAVVWVYLIIAKGEKRQMVNVDEFGNVSLQKV